MVVGEDLEGALGDDLAKKPRILRCLRVAVEDADKVEADFFNDGVFAGVRVSVILTLSADMGGYQATICIEPHHFLDLPIL